MALVECSECGRDVSDRAAACPGCGYIISAQNEILNTSLGAKDNHVISVKTNNLSLNTVTKEISTILVIIALLGLVLLYVTTKPVHEIAKVKPTYLSPAKYAEFQKLIDDHNKSK